MSEESPFVAILHGEAPGTIIARDPVKRFAIIEAMHPEAAVHWLAIPYESYDSLDTMRREDSERFLSLIDYAITETKARADDHPDLTTGFTIKVHLGTFETVPHAKLHILSSE